MYPVPLVLPWRGVSPQVDATAYLSPGVTVLGDVHIGAESSVWFGSVLRGDVHEIRIGKRSNIQDLSMVHVLNDRFGTYIGDDVTGGHRVTLHGCTIGDRVLLGMGCIVLDGAVIGSDVIVGAGALVPPGMKVPSGVLVVGSPAKVKRELTDDERALLLRSSQNYVDYSREYMQAFAGK